MKKRILGLVLTLLMILSLLPVSAVAEEAWMSFYVSPSGSDDAAGTQSAPFKTILRAQEEVRKYNQNMQGNIAVNLMPGRYELTEQLDFKQADSGSNGYDVIWRATDPNNMPIISGAKEVKGTWVEGENGIWHTQAEDIDFARSIFVNGKKAIRAKASKKSIGFGEYTVKENYVHPILGEKDTVYKGFYASKDEIGVYENPEDVELHSTMIFRTAMFHVTDIYPNPGSPESEVIVELGDYWNEYRLTGNDQWMPYRGFVVENAYELLDTPGEFYFNRKTKRLSYIPEEGQDMNNAEVLVPVLEQIMHIHGGNRDNKLTNIRFENITFAHGTSNQFQTSDSASGQGDFHYLQEATEGTSKFAINMEWCNEVDFNSCVFYGLDAAGIYMKWGVENCEIVGSVFADLGGHGIMGGSITQDTNRSDYTPTDGPADAAFGGSFFTSYVLGGTGYARDQISVFRSDSSKTKGGDGWYSNPRTSDEEYQWVVIEMLSKAKLESIEYTFPSKATDVQRSNFAIQVSNDRSFKTYETVATIEGPSDYRGKVDVESDEAWRYIRFIKTELEPFALSGCFAWSYDVMPQGNEGTCRDNLIQNCYFTRVGQQNWVAVPIFLMYTRDYKIIHNTFHDVPYTGVSIGWGWWHTNNDIAGGNEVLYNHFDDITKSANDGGCLYIFGNQNNSTKRSQIRGNYFSNATSGWGCALYMDSGNQGIDVYDNVALNTRNVIAQNNSTGYITVKNFYTADNMYRSWNQLVQDGSAFVPNPEKYYRENKDYFDMDDPIQFVYSDPPEEVSRIIANAGIEDEWLWILDRVPEKNAQNTILIGPDAMEAEFARGQYGMRAGYGRELEIETAQHILNNGTFGTLPWNFKMQSKIDLEHAIHTLTNYPTRVNDLSMGHRTNQELLKEAIDVAYKTLIHPSYEEMIKYCEAFANEAKAPAYLQADIDAFVKEVEAIKAKNPESRGDKGAAARELEIAYNKLWNTNRIPQLVDANIENGTSKVDLANKKVTVYMPFGVKAGEREIHYIVGPNTEIAVDLSKISVVDSKAIVPLKNSKTGQYASWAVEFVESTEQGTAGRISIDPADWTAGNINNQYRNDAGHITLDPYYLPSMYKKLVDNNISFSMSAQRMDLANGYKIIFGAQTCEDLDIESYYDKNTCYMLELRNQDLALYKIKGGNEELHSYVYECGFEYGQFNDVEITTTNHNGLNRITVSLNGAIVIDTLVDEPIGQTGYFGIWNLNVPVLIK